jgi:hypothetical protein
MAEQWTGSSIELQINDLLVSDSKINVYNFVAAGATDLTFGKLLKYASEGVKAVGTVTFTFTAATGGEIIPAGTIVENASASVQFVTDQAVYVAATDTTADVPCTAIYAGTAGNVAISAVDALVSAVPDLTVSGVANAAAFTTGADANRSAMVAYVADDDPALIQGVLYEDIDVSAAGTYTCDVVTQGRLNRSRVQLDAADIGAIPLDAIYERLRNLDIYLVGLV